MEHKAEVLGKMIMISEKQREMFQLFTSKDDLFVSHLFTYGIQFDSDFWGIIPNNLMEITRCLTPNVDWPKESVEKAMAIMEKLGLIQYFGKDNFLIYVVDYGQQNYIPYMRSNFFKNNKKPKFEREMKQAIKNGELPPWIMDAPQIAKKGSSKANFIEGFLNKTLHTDPKLRLLFDSMMYQGVYMEYAYDTKKESEVKNELPNPF